MSAKPVLVLVSAIKNPDDPFASHTMKSLSSTAKLAWLALAINLITVLGGTLVRATGSGAGCGESWPSCHGALLPGLADFHTRVEFAHRFTSGLALLSVLALFVQVYRKYARGSQARRAVQWTAVAIIVESLLGAWLVLARLVEDDASVMRAISVPVHLVNTLFLLGALTAAAWILTAHEPLRWPREERGKLIAAGVGLLILSATGAVTALADTLFPLDTLQLGLSAQADATAHFLTRLRVVHPVVAVVVSGLLIYLAASIYEQTQTHARALLLLIGLQLVLGVANVLLFTPVTIQVLHLLVADLLWVVLVLTAAELGREQKPYSRY